MFPARRWGGICSARNADLPFSRAAGTSRWDENAAFNGGWEEAVLKSRLAPSSSLWEPPDLESHSPQTLPYSRRLSDMWVSWRPAWEWEWKLESFSHLIPYHIVSVIFICICKLTFGLILSNAAQNTALFLLKVLKHSGFSCCRRAKSALLKLYSLLLHVECWLIIWGYITGWNIHL